MKYPTNLLASSLVCIAVLVASSRTMGQGPSQPYDLAQPVPGQESGPLYEAGLSLEQAGKLRNRAFWTAVASGFVAGMAIIADDGEGGAGLTGGLALGAIGVGVSTGFGLAANGREKRAGRLLQQAAR